MESKIWNLERCVADMADEIKNTQKLSINLNHEGPCAASLGLYKLLDYLCEKFNLDKSNVVIHTSNLIEHHPQYTIIINPPSHPYQVCKVFDLEHQLSKDKKITNGLKKFGMFIGRSNWARLWMAGHLYRRFKEESLLTFHWQSQDDFHEVHLGIDDMIYWHASMMDVQDSFQMLADCPITLDEINRYPLHLPENLNICKFYPNFFAEIVCETYFNGDTFFPTEKIWRPLMMKTPFIVYGPVDYLRYLRSLGFRTFDQWWNEQYDDYGQNVRISKILPVLQYLSSMDSLQLNNLYRDMLPTLEHNYEIFCSLNPKQWLTQVQQTFNHELEQKRLFISS